jgi:hypothetical protein
MEGVVKGRKGDVEGCGEGKKRGGECGEVKKRRWRVC